MNKQQALEAVEQKRNLILRLNDEIWGYAEMAYREHRSAEALCTALEEEGFRVERGVAGIPTAFTASFGTGKPVIGILGEYDALSGLNQKGCSTQKEPTRPEMAGMPGHGCGHNSLGTGALGAALAVKAYLEHTPGKSGTVVYFGCPAEEGGSGKTYMARSKVFDICDAAITWHPDSANFVRSGSSLANYQVSYTFTGVAAHAAADPHLGRSALDAVELMNIGVQFLREHIPDAARIHYAITDTGGYSPNVVQPKASVLYLIRSPKNPEVEALYQRVNKIARGAAEMTETSVDIRFIKACSNSIPNNVLERLLYQNFLEVGPPTYTPAEYAFAKTMVEGYENGFQEEQITKMHPDNAAYFARMREAGHLYLNDFLLPYVPFETVRAGSTDVGDVSWICPTAQICTALSPAGTPGHSWQRTACGVSSLAHKGLLYAAKVMAGAVIDLLEKPDVLAEAQAELKRRLGGQEYVCPIPDGVMPMAMGK